jgi:hypothetical protein
MISKEIAHDIAMAYREIEVGEKLLGDVKIEQSRQGVSDIRDAFGRRQSGLQLGVPSAVRCSVVAGYPYP